MPPVTLARKTRRYWTCRKCSHRNERTSSRKCQGCGEQTKPKARVPRHAEVLRDTPPETAAVISRRIHGGELGSCAVCGKPRSEGKRHDRDHDHHPESPIYGRLRGLACYRCNHHLLRFHTIDTLRACLAYMERAEAYYAREDS